MIRHFLPKSRFSRNVITLITGTGLAQALPIAITPILTRMYTPEEFGVFALYMAISSILAVLVTGRYELAIVVPQKDEDAISIVALSIGLSVFVSTLLLCLVFAVGSEIEILLGSKGVSNWLYFIPLTTLVMGCYQSLNYWCNRRSHYKRMAVSRVLQSSAASATQLSSGMLKIGSLGLVVGQFVGQLVSVYFLARSILKEEKEEVQKITKKSILNVASKYANFPKYLIIAHGFNTGSSQAPVILLSGLFTTAASGYYMLTQRVLGAPVALVAAAIGDVFRQQASYEYARTGQCKLIYLQTLKKLIGLSIVPFFIFFVFAEVLFEYVFGEEWIVAGEYAKILTPIFFMRFVASPLSAMFMIAEAQRMDLLWQIALFSLVLASLIVASLYENIELALYLFCVSYCLMFAVNLLLSFKLSCGRQAI